MENRKIIDVHTHIFPEKIADKATDHLGKYYDYVIHGKGTFADLTAEAKAAGITKLVVFSTATKAEQVENVNSFTADYISENIVGLGSLHPDYQPFEAEVARIKQLGLKGIKLHPDFQQFNIDDPRMYPVYELLQAEGLPVLFHVGDETFDYSSPKRLAKVLDDFPRLTVIAAHLGGYMRWDEACEYLIGRELYIDTSSVYHCLSHEQIVSIIRKHDINRVLFGTDYPIDHYDYNFRHFDALGLTQAEQDKILYDNTEKLFFSE